MKYERIEIAESIVCKASPLQDKKSLEQAKKQAKAKTPHTNRNSPSAQKRTDKEIFNAQLLGTIADIACSSLIRSYLDKYSPNDFVVERYDDIRQDGYQEPDLFDTHILSRKSSEILAEIEIRSSVCNKIPVEPMLRRWHILGWYTTKNKPAEKIRDFYVRPIYHYKKYSSSIAYTLSNAEEHLVNGDLDLYIVGGATSSILNAKGEVQQGFGLLQDGASYQVVLIKDGLNIEDFLKATLRFCLDKL